MRITAKTLWADECAWKLQGGDAGAAGNPPFKKYWIFDPLRLADEWGRSDIKRGACESYWFEEGEVEIDGNLFFFETREEAEQFRTDYYQAQLGERDEAS